jgi:hypothetical protein
MMMVVVMMVVVVMVITAVVTHFCYTPGRVAGISAALPSLLDLQMNKLAPYKWSLCRSVPRSAVA